MKEEMSEIRNQKKGANNHMTSMRNVSPLYGLAICIASVVVASSLLLAVFQMASPITHV
jgi:hypothetical protein